MRRALFEYTGGSYPEVSLELSLRARCHNGTKISQLITRGDMKVFLPPIGKQHGRPLDTCFLLDQGLLFEGGLTVYCFGDPAKMSDDSCRLALRIHDEVGMPPTGARRLDVDMSQCNGSDVFGSDICTCRPYLIFGIEEAVKEAQAGGSGVVIYFRKEGRALGEVTKVCWNLSLDNYQC